MDILWGSMILTGIIFGAFAGNLQGVTDAALEASGEAVSLCIVMAGVIAFWSGLMEIAKEAGMIDAMTKRMEPVIHFLFPRIPKGHPAREQISVNMIANILGLGWAATPAGLQAMESLALLEKERKTVKPCAASNEMCTFLIINISSLQLIPLNMIAYRSRYGSADPSYIIGPGIAATMVSTLAAVIFCKCMERLSEKRVR